VLETTAQKYEARSGEGETLPEHINTMVKADCGHGRPRTAPGAS
jgi:hypothetical protein